MNLLLTTPLISSSSNSLCSYSYSGYFLLQRILYKLWQGSRLNVFASPLCLLPVNTDRWNCHITSWLRKWKHFTLPWTYLCEFYKINVETVILTLWIYNVFIVYYCSKFFVFTFIGR